MMLVLQEKFKHPYLRELLIATGTNNLIDPTGMDQYFGIDTVGNNALGQALMQIRTEAVLYRHDTNIFGGIANIYSSFQRINVEATGNCFLRAVLVQMDPELFGGARFTAMEIEECHRAGAALYNLQNNDSEEIDSADQQKLLELAKREFSSAIAKMGATEEEVANGETGTGLLKNRSLRLLEQQRVETMRAELGKSTGISQTGLETDPDIDIEEFKQHTGLKTVSTKIYGEWFDRRSIQKDGANGYCLYATKREIKLFCNKYKYNVVVSSSQQVQSTNVEFVWMEAGATKTIYLLLSGARHDHFDSLIPNVCYQPFIHKRENMNRMIIIANHSSISVCLFVLV